MSKKFPIERIFYRAVLFLVRVVGKVRLSRLRALGRLTGRLCYIIDSRHRRIAKSNLNRAFGKTESAAWIEEKARLCFMHVAQVFLEFVWAITQSDERLVELMEYVGMEHYHEAIAKGRGVVFLTLHQGNWELMPPIWGLKYGIPLHVVVRRMDQNVVEELATRFRTRGGNVMVPKQRAMRALLKAVKNNQRIGILLDQNVDWYDGVWADFFGSPACTNKGLALLALRTGVPVLPATNFRLPSGRFMTFIFPEVLPVETGDRTKDIEETTARYNKILEKMISICPEQWFWVHQRWKTRPYRFWPRELNR